VTPVSEVAPDSSRPTEVSSAGRHWARGTIVVAASLAIAQIFAFLVSIIAARALGPSQFGVLAALLNVLLIGNVIALGLQAVIARTIVTLPGAERGAAGRHALATGLTMAVAVSVAALAISPLLQWILQIEGWWSVLLVAATLLPLTWIGAQLGVAQGRESFGRLAAVYAAVGVGRGIGGIAGALLASSATSTLLGIFLGTTAGAILGRVVVSSLTGHGDFRISRLYSQVAHAAHALLALFVLTNIDVILARALLGADEAGLYGVGAVITKVAFWLPQFVGVVAFPRLADDRRARALVLTVGAVGGLGGLVVLGTALLPGLAVGVAGGPDYTALVPLAWLFAVIGALFSLAQVLLMSRLAVDDRVAVFAVWAAIAVLLILAIWVLPHTVAGLATSAAIAGAVLVIAGLAQAITERTRN